MTNPRPNPYPGPRPFKRGETLYGRERETAELLGLLIAERIVLLSSPSGAGKTSLVQAALVPELEREGFRVLPVMRPGLLPDEPAAGANRYILKALYDLEEGLYEDETEERRVSPAELGAMSLAGYLGRLPAPAGDDPLGAAGSGHGDVLIFDQFEEVLTVDPTDRDAKLTFFEQVARRCATGTAGRSSPSARSSSPRWTPTCAPSPPASIAAAAIVWSCWGPTPPRKQCSAPPATRIRPWPSAKTPPTSWPTTCGGPRCSSRTAP